MKLSFERKTKIVVYILTLNEEFFLPLSLESVIDNFDKVYILDGGSTDRTEEIAREICGDKLIWECRPQNDERFGDDWNQQERRNYVLDEIDKWDGYWWILEIGADEVVDDKLWLLTQELNDDRSTIYVMPTYNFWGDMKHFLRGDDEHIVNKFHFHDPHARLWRSKFGIRHNEREFHCMPVRKDENACNTNFSFWVNIFLFHLHHGFGPRLDDINHDTKNRPRLENPILMEYNGRYPYVLEKYLKENNII